MINYPLLSTTDRVLNGTIQLTVMPHNPTTPGETEVFGVFRKHLGPRFTGAGLGVQFHYNQKPGIHFKVDAPAEYQQAITKGLQDAMAVRFPAFPTSGSVWITRIEDNEIDSSWNAFYQAARMVIEQAYALTQPVEA